MEGMSRHSWFRSATSPSVPLLALIVLLGVGGFVLTSTTIRRDRDAAAERRARVEAVHAQEVLGRARAYVAGLADVLAREPAPGQQHPLARLGEAPGDQHALLGPVAAHSEKGRVQEQRRQLDVVEIAAPEGRKALAQLGADPGRGRLRQLAKPGLV